MDHFLTANAQYDYILNLSALKHVRSERDPYTLMRLVEVNITNTIKIAQVASQQQVKKYFFVFLPIIRIQLLRWCEQTYYGNVFDARK